MNSKMMLEFLKKEGVTELSFESEYNPVLVGKEYTFNLISQELLGDKDEIDEEEEKHIFALYAELDEETSSVFFTINCDENFVIAAVPVVKLMRNGIKLNVNEGGVM